MQVTVGTNYLNVRTGLPSVNAPTSIYKSPGDVIEIDGQLYKGNLYQNIDTWVKDLAGNYYWSGGFVNGLQDYLNAALNGSSLNFPINYNYFLNIIPSIKDNTGQGVTIVIIDHPISSNIQSNIPVLRPIGSADPQANFHANFIFGLIAGISNIVGISNNIQVISLPIYDELGFPIDNGIENALNYIQQSTEPMIINISNGFDDNYDDIFNKFSSNKIIVSCAGVNTILTSNPIRYPASYPNAIAVGAMDVQFNTLSINSKVNFLIPNFDFVSYNINPGNYISDSGDSYATAIVSSIIALLINSGKSDFSRSSILTALNSNALPVTNLSAFSSLSLLNI